MISEIGCIINGKSATKFANRCKKVHGYVKTELGELSRSRTYISTKQTLKLMGQFLLDKSKKLAKNMKNFLQKHFSEAGKSKKAGIDPLKDKDLQKFIDDTKMYDPNSPDYIHANWSVPKKSD